MVDGAGRVPGGGRGPEDQHKPEEVQQGVEGAGDAAAVPQVQQDAHQGGRSDTHHDVPLVLLERDR